MTGEPYATARGDPKPASVSDEIRVLIVEDEAPLADLYAEYLDDSCSVRIAPDGREALDRIDESIDVVLLDRRMPDMDGDEVVARLRERGFETPVAMVTAVDPDFDIVELQIDEYLTKPIDRDTLQRTVSILANRSRFETHSREFFQLAAKQASIARDRQDGALQGPEYESLLERMRELQSTLDQTIRNLMDGDAELHADRRPDEVEIELLLEEIHEHTLPDEIEALLRSYAELEHARPRFMWKWVHRLAPQNELPFVDPDHTEKVAVDKTLVILFTTVLDDVFEKDNDLTTFDELTKIPTVTQHPNLRRDGIKSEYVAVAQEVWDTLESRLRASPAFDRYEELFRFDFKQAITAIEYSDLAIRRPDLATMVDLERFEAHNMVMLAYADIDLMHAEAKPAVAMAPIREVVRHAQMMARIGNWVSTWERELLEGDFSAGPIVFAVEHDIITPDELLESRGDHALAEELADRIRNHGIEAEFLTRWERHYHSLRLLDDELDAIDLESFIDGTEEILRYHLASRGLK